MVLGIILLPFWSAYTEAWLKNDIGWIKSTLKKLKMFWLLLTMITLIMLIFSTYIYAMWVGKEIVIPFTFPL